MNSDETLVEEYRGRRITKTTYQGRPTLHYYHNGKEYGILACNASKEQAVLRTLKEDIDIQDGITNPNMSTDINVSQIAHFVESYNQIANIVHQTAKDKGWWDKERNDGEMIALMHSELSEALEALRQGNPPDDKVPQFSGAEAEMADVIIRIMDMGVARGWDIPTALITKIIFNAHRERMHGGKAF